MLLSSTRADLDNSVERGISATSASAAAPAPPAAANAAAIRSAPARSPIARRTAALSRSGVSFRTGSRTPAPATSTRGATSGWSRPKGTATTGTPWASAFCVVHTGVTDDAGGALEQQRVRHETFDVHIGRRIQAGGVDVRGRDDDVEGLAREGRAHDLRQAAVVLEQGRAADEDERLPQLIEPDRRRRRLGRRLPEAGADELETGRPVGARVLKRLRRVGEHDRSGQVDVLDLLDGWEPDLGAERIHVLGDHALERPKRERLRDSVAQASEAIAAWTEAEPEGRRVARGHRNRRDDRERPRKAGALGRGRRAPSALVDEDNVRPLGLDRLLQIAELEGRPLAELAEALLSAPKRVRARQSPGSNRSISALNGSTSRSSTRSRSTSSIPQRTTTR